MVFAITEQKFVTQSTILKLLFNLHCATTCIDDASYTTMVLLTTDGNASLLNWKKLKESHDDSGLCEDPVNRYTVV